MLCEPTQQARNDACAAEAKRGGMTVVPPYNHPDVIAGQGTLGLEMAEQIDNLDAVIVPTSGGGMLAGVAMALAPQGIKVYAVEPAGKRLAEALAAGKRVVDAESVVELNFWSFLSGFRPFSGPHSHSRTN